MAQWLQFEVQCTDYLNQKFGDRASFVHLGGEDSTVPDIRVTTHSGRTFYMDAKLAPAQCGQFVLLPDLKNSCFVFSSSNKTELTPEVQRMMEHMNSDFQAYKEAGTAGKTICLEDNGKTFHDWIISTYRNKGAEFFITNDYTILPIDDFSKFFDVTATYRVKRSGSSAVGSGQLNSVIQHIKSSGYPVEQYCTEGSKLFVYASQNMHNKRFMLGGFEYMFSAREDRYEIRKLSNTFNANVIFSISPKYHQGLSDAEFAAFLY